MKLHNVNKVYKEPKFDCEGFGYIIMEGGVVEKIDATEWVRATGMPIDYLGGVHVYKDIEKLVAMMKYADDRYKVYAVRYDGIVAEGNFYKGVEGARRYEFEIVVAYEIGVRNEVIIQRESLPKAKKSSKAILAMLLAMGAIYKPHMDDLEDMGTLLGGSDE